MIAPKRKTVLASSWKRCGDDCFACLRCSAEVPLTAIGQHRCGRPDPILPHVAQGPCVHRGDLMRMQQCPTCAGHVQLKIFTCDLHGECCLDKTVAGVRSCRGCGDHELPYDWRPPSAPPRLCPSAPSSPGSSNYRHSFHYDARSGHEFVTLSRFAEDIKALVAKLPSDASRIIGVARSGLYPATMIAELLHLPLLVLRQMTGDIVDGGSGWRLSSSTQRVPEGTTVVIDDTVMTGNSYRQIEPIVRGIFPDAITAAVYCNPRASKKPDLWARDLPWPHLLEWNLFNSVLTPNMALDFDGILCHDCGPGDDDDGPRYAKFLAEARPLYYVRKCPIPLIVTARLEKYRGETLAWLARHRMTASKLVMWPGTDHRERNRSDVGGWKAKHFAEFAKIRRHVKPSLFVESDAGQARRIAEVSGGLVVCPPAGRCFLRGQP